MDETNLLTFMAYVHLNEKLRDEGTNCEEEVEKTKVKIFSRNDLYLALDFQKPTQGNEITLRTETLKTFVKNGAHLEAVAREKYNNLMQELVKLELDFEKNLREDKTVLSFTLDEFEGISQELIKSFGEPQDGKYSVKANEPNYVQFLENAKNEETRKKMYLAFLNRAAEQNTDLLQRALKLRHELAKLLGFNNWADFKINDRMAKSAQVVKKFLEGLREKFQPKIKAELAELRQYKKLQTGSDVELQAWDIFYFSNQVKKEKPKRWKV
ncbi:MAG: hypothetical protein HY072_03630 [Deltaproteobacteria bacterium]|nr:hypothetical protein [Deltaproteobacteria bacterium]